MTATRILLFAGVALLPVACAASGTKSSGATGATSSSATSSGATSSGATSSVTSSGAGGGATTGSAASTGSTGGSGGAGAGGGAPCGGADLQTDPKNCGACGHSCLDETCAGGQCQPTQVAAVGNAIIGNGFAIATDGTWVYWVAPGDAGTSGGTLMRAPCDGSQPPTSVPMQGTPGIGPIVGNDMLVLSGSWTGSGTPSFKLLVQDLVAGSQVELFGNETYPYWPGRYAVDGQRVLFVSQQILSAPIGGGPVAPLTTGTINGQMAVTTDDKYLYALDSYAGQALYRTPKAGGGAVDMFPAQFIPATLLPMPTGFLGLRAWGGGQNCPHPTQLEAFDPTGVTTTVGVFMSYPQAVLADAQSAYYLDECSNDVLEMSLADGSVRTLSNQNESDSAFAIDNRYVYFFGQIPPTYDQAILRVAK